MTEILNNVQNNMQSDGELSMEMWEDELSPAQKLFYSRSESDFREITLRVAELIKNQGGEIVDTGQDVEVYEYDVLNPSLTVLNNLLSSSSQQANKGRSSIRLQSPSAILQPSQLQTPALNTGSQLVLQGGGSAPMTTVGSNQPSTNTYQFVVDPRLGHIIVNAVPNQQTGGQIVSTAGISKTLTSVPPPALLQTPRVRPVQSRSLLTHPVGSSNCATVPSSSVSSPQISSVALPSLTAVGSTPSVNPVATVRVKKSAVPLPYGNKNSSTVPRPTESNCVGGLSAGSTQHKDKKKDESNNSADSREITLSKMSGKTFPSLVVVARAHLQTKEQSVEKSDRTALDQKVKSVLLYTPTKFTEWLIQQGLVRSEQHCNVHAGMDGPNKLKLGMYSDVSKFPYSGGYVWISECCPQRFVSVFSGSIFEGAPHPPTMLLKLMYHWCCQTNVQNVVQWVKVDNFYIKNFFTTMRSVCIAAVHEMYGKIGGPLKKVEVGVISLGTTTQGGSTRQVKVEVLGVMDSESKLVRLRAIDPLQDGERNYKRRFVKILEPLEQWVHKDSIIVTDFTVDKGTLVSMGFKQVIQATIPESSISRAKSTTNQNVMDYLRRIVPRMFQNTLSLLSRQIIQQFLDELVWRERWGAGPAKAFDSLISHLAAQTKLDTGETLLAQLTKITSNPFLNWEYSNWRNHGAVVQSSTTSTTNNTNVGVNFAPIPSVVNTPKEPPTYITKKINMKSFINLYPELANSNEIQVLSSETLNKQTGEKVSLAEATAKVQETVKPPPLENLQRPVQVPLTQYYYGTKVISKEVHEKESKTTTLNVKCPLCQVLVQNNLELMKHLFRHSDTEPTGTDIEAIIQCRYCVKNFHSDADLKHHISETHINSGYKYCCLICTLKFTSQDTLVSHMNKMHTELELPYQCSICFYRSSEHYKLVDHFYEVHGGGEKVQCPFCLKCVAIIANGKKVAQNNIFFMHHLRKHQSKGGARKCDKCVLWFVHKGLLKEHEFKDHISCKNDTSVVPYTAEGVQILISVSSMRTYPPPPFLLRKFTSLKVNGISGNLPCLECASVIRENHFIGSISCLRCSFITCCKSAVAKHATQFHGKTSSKSMYRDVLLSEDMHCVCGFKSKNGTLLANHLGLCEKKTVYPSVAAVAALSQSASFPPLVSLDLENEDSPSEQWMKAFSAKKDEPNKVDSEKKPDTGDPPSMLDCLGLMRKPSTEDSDKSWSSMSDLNQDSNDKDLEVLSESWSGRFRKRSARQACLDESLFDDDDAG